MNLALTLQNYLALNDGRYERMKVRLPNNWSNICVTSHTETADTDLLHFHDTSHLSFVLSGGVIDKRRSSEREVPSGDVMFFRAGEPHQSIMKGFPVRNVNIELGWDFYRDNDVDESHVVRVLRETPWVRLAVLNIYRELRANDDYSLDSIGMLLLNLVESPVAAGKRPPQWIGRIAEMLRESWAEDLTVDDLAAAANVHPKTVSKYFPRYFNCTLGDYRRRVRIDRAISLIRSSNLSLTEIAYECGFYDQSHFTASFKRLTGFGPRQFRKL